jgi:hypothetical protein
MQTTDLDARSAAAFGAVLRSLNAQLAPVAVEPPR